MVEKKEVVRELLIPLDKVLFLTKEETESCVEMWEVMEAVEWAFAQKGKGSVQMPAKNYVFFDKYDGDFRVMPAYLEETDVAGVKIVNVHPKNRELFKLPSVMAVVLMMDPRNGLIYSIMNGTHLTALRTGASGGIAIKYLARKNSEIMGLIGAGIQARTQLEAAFHAIHLRKCFVYDIVKAAAESFKEKMEKKLEVEIVVVDEPRKAVEKVDVLATVTPARSPVVKDEWIGKGTHINAIGADAPGKQELESTLLKRAKIVIDDWEQAIHSGEVNVPLLKGIIKENAIYAELGDIIVGKKLGRENDEEITIFDSTGLAIQDVSTGWVIYQKARRNKIGTWLQIV